MHARVVYTYLGWDVGYLERCPQFRGVLIANEVWT